MNWIHLKCVKLVQKWIISLLTSELMHMMLSIIFSLWLLIGKEVKKVDEWMDVITWNYNKIYK